MTIGQRKPNHIELERSLRYPLQHFRGRDEIPFSHEPKFVMAIGNPNLKSLCEKGFRLGRSVCISLACRQ